MTGTLEVRIDSIAAGGDGVGRHDGMVVFVPRSAPGDLARVRAVRHDRLMRGAIVELIHPSAARSQPPCEHYVVDRCGGCQIQHLRYDAQLTAKAGIIRDSLTRIGKVPVDAAHVEPSDQQWRYRSKLTLALRQSAGRWMAGLHRFDAPDEVFPLVDCLITDESVMRVWASVLSAQHLLPSAPALRGAVRALSTGFSFTLEGARAWGTHREFFAAVPELVELWWQPDGKARRLLHTRTGDTQAGASFVQVNPTVAAKLNAWVMALAKAVRPGTAVDAYAGTGDLAVALAAQGIRVTAIEIDRDAAKIAASRLPAGSRVVATSVENALPKTLPADLVVLNPPRVGVHEQVTAILRAQSPKPKALLYVSCNPATLARDLRRLEGYEIRSLRGFDMFPQTAHVETVCELVPAA